MHERYTDHNIPNDQMLKAFPLISGTSESTITTFIQFMHISQRKIEENVTLIVKEEIKLLLLFADDMILCSK
jgi:hypothetical protein